MRACTWILVLVGAVFVSAGCGDDDSGQQLDAGTCAVACDDNNLCNGVETCRNGSCTPGQPLPDGASCGSGVVCRASACVSASCGNGFLDAGEECDDGNATNGDGCDTTCKFSCLSTDATRSCASSNECVTGGVCNDTTHTCTTGSPVADNTACPSGGPNNYCVAGVCTAPSCGNGTTEPGEECDGGPGCTSSCAFLCTDDPANQCAVTPNACSVAACAVDHSCTTLPDETANGKSCDSSGDVCVSGQCQAPTCGDGIREAGEQCDDGNALNLDGCDSNCQFEEDQRAISRQQQFGTDSFCTQNALGTAITPDAQPTIQLTWDQPVTDGSLSIVFTFLGIKDLTGGDTPFTLGFVRARAAGRTLTDSPVCGNGVCEESTVPGNSEFGGANTSPLACPADCVYDGNTDLDWWYLRDPTSVDANETPLVQLPGQITSGHLSAGPGTISLDLLFAFQPANVTLFDTRVEALVDGAVNAPTLSIAGSSPGHLASEHLVSTLTSVSGSSTGSMCSNVSAASLFNTPIPPLLLGACTFDDAGANPIFTSANTLLDVFVAGCLVFSQPAITATQPDGSRDGAAYQLVLDANRTVTGCTRNGAPANLQDCLDAATFSSYFKFAADRVIIRRN